VTRNERLLNILLTKYKYNSIIKDDDMICAVWKRADASNVAGRD